MLAAEQQRLDEIIAQLTAMKPGDTAVISDRTVTRTDDTFIVESIHYAPLPCELDRAAWFLMRLWSRGAHE
jgi:hypothetical protein